MGKIYQTCYVNGDNSFLIETGTPDNPVTYSAHLGRGIYIPATDWHIYGLHEKLKEVYGDIKNIPNYWETRKTYSKN